MSEPKKRTVHTDKAARPAPDNQGEKRIKVVATNRKAHFQYELLARYEAGLSLVGTEVKSLRLGKVQLSDAYVEIDGGEAFLVNLHISQYDMAHSENHDPVRKRRLLLKKREIHKLWGATNEKGFTIIPTKIYFKGAYAKIEIATARGKRQYDKRETIARKEAEREMARKMRGRGE
jgi:SsrA-binding protein